uniref:Uncharacterized protein n=1 Tax=Arundo donax TaxID=35708 RepID=A0A0A9CSJ2_ARUDO
MNLHTTVSQGLLAIQALSIIGPIESLREAWGLFNSTVLF